MSSFKSKEILYGGDYNPDQWPREVWEEDIRLMKHYGVNTVTLPVFSWAKLQPAENEYNFDWLDDILGLLADNEIKVIMATPTAAQPAWMSKKYPDILPIDQSGKKMKHGGRVNFCPNSDSYRKFSTKIAAKMAKRYQNYSGLLLWHINNEYGGYCYCDNCRDAFRDWLKDKYKKIEELNKSWYTNFWGHTFYKWDEIEIPSELSEILPGRLGDRDGTNFQAIATDYKRFMSDSILECFINEKKVIKEYTPDIPVTTNIWGISDKLDLFKWAEHNDICSWDNYPTNKDKPGDIAFRHDVIRSLKDGSPFILMEQTPGQQNWQDYNALKRPGVMRLLSYQTIAHGADGILFFQWRQSKGACEKYHAAMVPHVGHENTRTGRELAQLGNEFKNLAEIVASTTKAEVGIIFDWPSWWSLEYSSGPSIDLKYPEQVQKYYRALYNQNISVDIIKPDADLSKYKIILAPVYYMVEDKAIKNINNFVENGGVFLTTFMSGMVDENDQVRLGGYPGAFRDLLGIWVEEIDALYPDMYNEIVLDKKIDNLNGKYKSKLICDVMHAREAEVIARFEKDYYQGQPAVTENSYGKGKAVYIGTDAEIKLLEGLIKYYCDKENVCPIMESPEGVEIAQRSKDGKNFTFVLNHNDLESELDLPEGNYLDLITNKTVSGTIKIAKKDVLILKEI
ncbi:beta-galactosidase [Natronospora cellulosivora (SeqCode)]